MVEALIPSPSAFSFAVSTQQTLESAAEARQALGALCTWETALNRPRRKIHVFVQLLLMVTTSFLFIYLFIGRQSLADKPTSLSLFSHQYQVDVHPSCPQIGTSLPLYSGISRAGQCCSQPRVTSVLCCADAELGILLLCAFSL